MQSPHTGECFFTKQGELLVRKNGGVSVLKGPLLIEWIKRKMGQNCEDHPMERVRFICRECDVSCCALCLLVKNARHLGHVYEQMESPEMEQDDLQQEEEKEKDVTLDDDEI